MADAPSLSRRHLLVLSTAAGLAACSSDPLVPDAGDTDAGDTDSGAPDVDTDAGDTDAGAPDVPASNCPSGTGISDAGAVTDFPVGAFTLVQQAGGVKFFVGHDAGGLFAMSALCTHTGCTLPTPNPAGFMRCPCHFSLFDRDGRVQAGSEARRDLQNFEVTVCEGRVYVNRRGNVATGTRTSPEPPVRM
ncbi:MAG: Rieske (2Fe-2S) protein [Polyangiales bacterium]